MSKEKVWENHEIRVEQLKLEAAKQGVKASTVWGVTIITIGFLVLVGCIAHDLILRCGCR